MTQRILSPVKGNRPRQRVIADDESFIFNAYGFPKAPLNVPEELKMDVPTQRHINALRAVDIPVTMDHGEWKVIQHLDGRRSRECLRRPVEVGRTLEARVDEQGRLDLKCRMHPTAHGLLSSYSIKDGRYRDISLGLMADYNMSTGEQEFFLDHVALVPTGRAQGTHIYEAECRFQPNLDFQGRHLGVDDPQRVLRDNLAQARQWYTEKAPCANGSDARYSPLAITRRLMGFPEGAAPGAAGAYGPSPPGRLTAAPSIGDSAKTDAATPCTTDGQVALYSAGGNVQYTHEAVNSRGSSSSNSSSSSSNNTTTMSTQTPTTTAPASAPVPATTTEAATPNAAPASVAAPAAPQTSITAEQLSTAVAGALAEPTQQQQQPSNMEVIEQLMQSGTPLDATSQLLMERTIAAEEEKKELTRKCMELEAAVASLNKHVDSDTMQKGLDLVNVMRDIMAKKPDHPVLQQYGWTPEKLNEYEEMVKRLSPQDRQLATMMSSSMAAFGAQSAVQFEHEVAHGATKQPDPATEQERIKVQQQQEFRDRMQMRLQGFKQTPVPQQPVSSMLSRFASPSPSVPIDVVRNAAGIGAQSCGAATAATSAPAPAFSSNSAGGVAAFGMGAGVQFTTNTFGSGQQQLLGQKRGADAGASTDGQESKRIMSLEQEGDEARQVLMAMGLYK